MAETIPTEHEQLLNDYAGLWNGDHSDFETVSESVLVADPGAPEGEIRGRDAFRSYLDELRTGFPDFHVRLDEVLAGDDVIMAEWTVTATHEGEFDGIPPTGRKMGFSGMDKLLVADGKVQEHHIYYDVQEMLEQLGLAEG